MKRALLAVLAAVLAVPVAGLLFVRFTYPRVGPAPELTVAGTPERIERGRYLFHHVALCAACHSERDWDHWSAPVVPGSLGEGGENVGSARSPVTTGNITPSGIGDWTDGEIFRAIACGVDRGGEPLHPLMPYTDYRQLPREDLEAIVAYVRTLAPIDRPSRENRAGFPEGLIFRMLPRDYDDRPVPTDPVERGRVLARVAGCYACHTPFEKGRFVDDLAFSGGNRIDYPGGTAVSANITPDDGTGIGFYGEDDFIELFHAYGSDTARRMPLRGGTNTVMPWTDLAGMTTEDLRAIHAYLRTVPPIVSEPER